MQARSENLELIRTMLLTEDWGDLDDDVKSLINDASNLSEMAKACQHACWDIRMFVGAILQTFDFNIAIDMNKDWLNEHCYGWDT